ncbi:NAD(+)/NADH kinase [Clostridium cylindrosporum]|uniref:NAD kinase n=1 Tax=Clostridium cylindrosporum DSM 605 TaxID=1121307 RepID=A0A0J8G0N1_CLOCY|nr:NAD(+)/NADH kinase [Clostridium cylindrosporum]KMT21356.1 NAD kinase NadK [Clostridium cylindrosporum DSM 605]
MAKFGIIVNLTKDIGLELTSSIINWLEEKGNTVLLTEIGASKINRPEIGYTQSEIYNNADFLIVLGGDGTLLGVARSVASSNIPILGINMGHLGFITEVEREDTFLALNKILNNDFTIQERILLEASVIKNGEKGESLYSFNDIGITKGTLSRLITLNIYADDEFVDTYNGDGILTSTPTGSTAYSLSAGGPIISPELGVMLITPICPHTLYSRSIVLSDSQTITVEIESSHEGAFLTCDGQRGLRLNNFDKVVINKAPFNVKLIKLSNRSFFDVLRNKLKQRTI